jgi:N-formylglutamate amidohydrolase
MKLYSITTAKNRTNNIIYNSPHSGEKFPDEFIKLVQIDMDILLSSGDSFVDKLFNNAQHHGSCLISNEYGRSFVDTNREAYELDPHMFSGEINIPLNEASYKVKLGFGSIAKFAYTRQNIYKGSIPFKEALIRLEKYYFPIHVKLQDLLSEQFDKYGYSLLVDCHSMPSYEFIGKNTQSLPQADIILGDCHGKSCAPQITHYLNNFFIDQGFSVELNTPFAGGYNTKHYGSPDINKHAVQIEIKKSLYMDEYKRTPNQKFNKLKDILSKLCNGLDNNIKQLTLKNHS